MNVYICIHKNIHTHPHRRRNLKSKAGLIAHLGQKWNRECELRHWAVGQARFSEKLPGWLALIFVLLACNDQHTHVYIVYNYSFDVYICIYRHKSTAYINLPLQFISQSIFFSFFVFSINIRLHIQSRCIQMHCPLHHLASHVFSPFYLRHTPTSASITTTLSTTHNRHPCSRNTGERMAGWLDASRWLWHSTNPPPLQ